MGLDYSMMILIPNNKKEKIYDYIKLHGSFYRDDRSFCSLKFNIDHNVIKYIQGWDDWKIMQSFEEDYDLSCFKENEFDSCWMIPKEYDNCNGNITPEFQAEIGGFDIHDKQCKDHCLIKITAVTSDMSQFISISLSVHNWLIECCKYVEAKLGYIDMETYGSRILYYDNKSVNLLLDGDSHIEMEYNDFISMMSLFKESLNSDNKSIVAIIPSNKKMKVYDYIKSHGSYNDDKRNCGLEFDIDYNVIRYLQGWNTWEIKRKWEKDNGIKNYRDFTEGYSKISKDDSGIYGHVTPYLKAHIDGININETMLNSYTKLEFEINRWNMTRLVENSLSVHSWLIDCCKCSEVDLGYIGVSSGENRILYYNKKALNLLVSGEEALKIQLNDFMSMIITFKRALDSDYEFY
ncbi:MULTISPECIES: hypothetical protein [unclassified Clostridium]|uniref:hypothetical protein n=1 Tax=unclassified Clostridium TaxID=2614128 RepID=UPI000297FF5A|nr:MULTISPECIES: hypothetical protein [unclassified Clostridium]EKQ54534.1 MAG: hypothetical protein A370_03124 [Clostridium sp. Maddingley MBC34-26]